MNDCAPHSADDILRKRIARQYKALEKMLPLITQALPEHTGPMKPYDRADHCLYFALNNISMSGMNDMPRLKKTLQAYINTLTGTERALPKNLRPSERLRHIQHAITSYLPPEEPSPAIMALQKAINIAATSHVEDELSLTQKACREFLGRDKMAEKVEAEIAAGKTHQRHTLNYTHTRPEVMAALTIRMLEEFGKAGGADAVEGALNDLPSPRRIRLFNAELQERIATRFPALTLDRISRTLRSRP